MRAFAGIAAFVSALLSPAPDKEPVYDALCIVCLKTVRRLLDASFYVRGLMAENRKR